MKINGQSLVELPPKCVDIHPVDLSHEEHELYIVWKQKEEKWFKTSLIQEMC